MNKKIAAMLAVCMLGVATTSTSLAISGADVVITGTFNTRYSSANDKGIYNFADDFSKSGFYHRADIGLIAPVSKDVSFMGMIFAGSHNTDENYNLGRRFDETSLEMAMIIAKKGNAEFNIGRLITWQGLGLTGSSPYFDGASVKLKNDKWTTTVTAGNVINCTFIPELGGPVTNNRTYYGVDVAYDVKPDKKIVATLWQDTDKDLYNAYKTVTVGYQQKLDQDWVFTGEYGRNDSNLANLKNSGSAADAYFARVKYRGAVPEKVGSNGAALMYVKADPYFDPSTNTVLETTPNGWGYPTNGSNFDNFKGLVITYEQTVFDNTVLKLNYAPADRVKDMGGVPKDRSYFTADLKLYF